MGRIEDELAAARKRLLDLTLRNRLLNHRASTRRTLRAVDELPRQIYETLVVLNKGMRFSPRSLATAAEEESPESAPDFSESVAWTIPNLDEPVSEKHSDLALQTELDKNQLYRRLSIISRESETLLDEQGYTGLFLALGFLKWYEAPTSEQPRKAPLLLVPVRLNRTGIRKSFKVHWTEEEVSENLSLREKMREFNLDLPACPPMPSKEKLVDYFAQIQRAVRDKKRWEVVQDVVLDLFSFSKFVMYKDLDPVAWPDGCAPADSEVLRAAIDPNLSDGGSPESEAPPFDSTSIDDVLTLSTLYHVKDADPSQIAVIEDAKTGRNLVVEGPPGTGKSQTITNLIAECMALGKSVLFVSEKMAALDVVNRRLKAVGLGSFCMEVHSRKSNKKAFLDQVAKSDRLSPVYDPGNLEREFAELESHRAKLNDYAKALREPVGPYGASPADLFISRERAWTHFRKAEREPAYVELDSIENRTPDEMGTARSQLRDLVSTLRVVGAVEANPWNGCRARNLLPPDLTQLEQTLQRIRGLLEQLTTAVSTLGDTAAVAKASRLSDLARMWTACRLVVAAPAVDQETIECAVRGNSPNRVVLIEAIVQFGALQERVLTRFKPEAFDCDIASLQTQLETYAASIFRWFRSDYWKFRRTLGALYVSGAAPGITVATEDLRTLREAMTQRTHIRTSITEGLKAFGSAWQGEKSDTEALKEIDKWLSVFSQHVEVAEIDVSAIAKVHDRHVKEAVPTLITEIESTESELRDSWSNVQKVLQMENSSLPAGGISEWDFADLDTRLQTWTNALPALADWSNFLYRRELVEPTCAAPLLSLIDRDQLVADDVMPTFEYNIAESVLKAAFQMRPALGNFSFQVHNDCIQQFSKLDKLLIEKNRARLAAKLSAPRPLLTPGASPSSDVGKLLAQTKKKKGQNSIRKLMTDCGDLVKRITPCFMMSPLSVAQFLHPTGTKFDVVIFDEASQIPTEEAYGALIRAKQAIVIGDTKQLPPTRFFSAMLDGEEDGAGAMESILHQCSTTFQTVNLEWHYRSEHESLIAVSNREFYGNKLMIYPSSSAESPYLGIKWNHVTETVYDKGGTAANRKEAEAVADAVIDHYTHTPNESLGVGAFSVAQQREIDQAIEVRLRARPDLFTYFNRDDQEEYCFVKNLETIQGDERDVIFVSVGYGRDHNGKLSQNFGPVNQDGGERRLNVLFTRARKRCEVFSNFSSKEIPDRENMPRGLKVFKQFLEYAKTGILPENGSLGDAPESGFEAAVADVLRAAGHDVVHQVGCAGFRVDLAVRDPAALGQYVIGIECDGAKYHSSRVARERDRLRQDILESKGWRIFRVWSTDWFQSRAKAQERLLKGVQDALAQTGAAPNSVTTPVENREESVPVQVLHDSGSEASPLEAKPYDTCSSLGSIDTSEKLHLVAPEKLAHAVHRVAEVESPVHKDEVVRRIRTLWGLGRAGNPIREAIRKGISAAKKSDFIRVRGDFIWVKNQDVSPVRRRHNDPPPDITLICREEIVEAIKQVLTNQGATAEKDLVIRIARLLGIGSVKKKVEQRIGAVVKGELRKGAVITRQDDGRIRLVPPDTGPTRTRGNPVPVEPPAKN